MASKDFQTLCEEKARKGDGAFAVAFALLELAGEQKKTARALDNLGFNDERPTGAPGTTEAIAIELKRIADALHERNSN